jgi:hypothetical protein
MTALPAAAPDQVAAPFHEALAAGHLTFQRCDAGHAWLPPRSHCPRCLSAATGWERAGGGATLISWVVYHRAFHPAFEERLPYNVALVELDEGPRLMTNVVGLAGDSRLRPGMALRLRVEREGDVHLARFEPA